MAARRTFVTIAACLVLAATAASQVPQTMNYQVMLTDDADQPLANQMVELVFRIYSVDAGGSWLWTETQNVETNAIGVVSLVLGEVNPINLLFSVPLWLEVEVDGEVLSPRRPLVSAPYARRAQDAVHANDSDHLDEIPADAYALDDDLWQPGVLNDPSNPLEWTKLKNVPGGFADGIDDAGAGDGHSLDASDGSPQDAVFVDEDGKVFLGETLPYARLNVRAPHGVTAAHFECDSAWILDVGVFATTDSSSGIVGNSGQTGGHLFPAHPAAVAGLAGSDANGGFFAAGDGSGYGAYCVTSGTGPALMAESFSSAYAGSFTGGSGVSIEGAAYPVLDVVNTMSGSGFGDAAYFESKSGAGSLTWTVYSSCWEGVAGRFQKNTDDDKYAVEVLGAATDAEGLYVQGTIFTTNPIAQGVETPRGTEAVFGVTSSEVTIIASGEGRLSAGRARVEFDGLFADSVAGSAGLRLTATPIGAWSAIYVEQMDSIGFELRSDAGDENVRFHWVAVGRAKGLERRPEITIPDPTAGESLARQKRAGLRARRPEQHERPQIIAVQR